MSNLLSIETLYNYDFFKSYDINYMRKKHLLGKKNMI